MNKSNYKILYKLQLIYNIIIVKDDTDERIFILNEYIPYTPQTPSLFIKGRDITFLIIDSGLFVSLSNSNLDLNSNEKDLLITKVEEIPVLNYRFSNHYRYEVMESK